MGGRGLGATQAGKLRFPDLIAGFVCLQTVSKVVWVELDHLFISEEKTFHYHRLSEALGPPKGLMSILCTYYTDF